MVTRIDEKFRRYPAQLKVVQLFMRLGLAVKDGQIYCDGIKISHFAVAKGLGVDRRAVADAVLRIQSDKELTEIFMNFIPTCNLRDAAPLLGYGVLEVVPQDSSRPGILAGVTRILNEAGISIRQVVIDNPQLSEIDHLVVVTDKPIPGSVIPEIKDIMGVKSVILH